jgi:hypothetical protein
VALHVTIETSLLFEQCFPFFIGEECRSIVLSSSQLRSPSAAARGVDRIHIHGIIALLPTLSLSFQGLFPLIAHVISKERIGKGRFIFYVRRVMCSGCLIPPM